METSCISPKVLRKGGGSLSKGRRSGLMSSKLNSSKRSVSGATAFTQRLLLRFTALKQTFIRYSAGKLVKDGDWGSMKAKNGKGTGGRIGLLRGIADKLNREFKPPVKLTAEQCKNKMTNLRKKVQGWVPFSN